MASVHPVRQLLPDAAEVDPTVAYLAADRPARPGRPWVLVGMVAAVDGATAVGGRSGALGGAADREVFRAVRAVADVVLVAAGTARVEGYGPVRLTDEARAARIAAGRAAEAPRLAVVSRSLDLGPVAERFPEHERRPLVLTTVDADEDRVRALAELAEVRRIGRSTVDLAAALGSLGQDGAAVVVCEGGPQLNCGLVAAGLVDELCVTIAPTLAGGDSARLATGAPEVAVGLELVSLLTAGGVLCGRWVRR